MAIIPIHLSTNDLLKGVEQLEITDLEDFIREVLLIRTRRVVEHLNKEESSLFEDINNGLSIHEQDQLQQLAQKRTTETMTITEHKTYMSLVDKLEYLNVKRITALGKLANLRGVSLREIMKELGVLQKVA